ncbi:hypothetical protein [Paenibacillus luteus]|nr:hypothetical protein [Paenibacillus luteus]
MALLSHSMIGLFRNGEGVIGIYPEPATNNRVKEVMCIQANGRIKES